jgi:hypothetical protein
VVADPWKYLSGTARRYGHVQEVGQRGSEIDDVDGGRILARPHAAAHEQQGHVAVVVPGGSVGSRMAAAADQIPPALRYDEQLAAQ